ncbi:hypothetical protein PISMIDRAFT_672872 [Pisolithus microcarpus 441]|uniref:Uncharacterized protein n=1 Tax=Pisolithus microcarpus 441 TaxID=765257 RepID=A0A0D0A9P8_9AGAM|nr:hypothetical protein BKA83DRAFT_672872 [Pisolithus microcarpus]KIK28708.1 hypothetical protein PISMIDRAFT_672872 [Pisolithus microcarpus 441]
MGDNSERSKSSRFLIRATFLKDALLPEGLYSLDKVLRIAIVQVKSLCHKAKMGGIKHDVSQNLPESQGNKKSFSVVRLSAQDSQSKEGDLRPELAAGSNIFQKKSAHLINADEDIGVGWTYETV